MSEEFVTPFIRQHICDSIEALRVAAKSLGGHLIASLDRDMFTRPLLFTFPDRDQYLAFLKYIGDAKNPDKELRTLIRGRGWKIQARMFYEKEVKSPIPSEPPLESKRESGPMLIRIMTNSCVHCTALESVWNAVESCVRESVPNLRTIEYEYDRETKSLDKTHPEGLNEYLVWFPMILLINGNLWDQAVEGQKNGQIVPLRQGVIIYNGTWLNGSLQYKQDHNNIIIWVRSLSSVQLKMLEGPIPETKDDPPTAEVSTSETPVEGRLLSTVDGPLDQLVANQSIVQATYDVLGQIKSLTTHPLRRFLAQAVIQEMAPYL